MKLYSALLVGSLVISFMSCEEEPAMQITNCTKIDREYIRGTWSSPRFVSNSTNCNIDNECVEIEIEIGDDGTYQLNYKVGQDLDAPEIIFSDQGTLLIDCIKAITSFSPIGYHRTIEWDITFVSDSMDTYEWNLTYRGTEGLILEPEQLNFEGAAYLILEKE